MARWQTSLRVVAWNVLTGMLVVGCAPMHRPAASIDTHNLGGPATVWDDPVVLSRVRVQLESGAGPREALAALIKEADKALDAKITSVLDKGKAGPSGDIHDYVSYAPYFWPNPNTKDGLPYVRHDGHRNQDAVSQGDANRYGAMHGTVHTLGLAYWYTGNPKYAQKATAIVRAWFLDPATRMNPNFQFAQAVRGVNDGRGIGLIENRGLLQTLDGLTLLDGSGEWTAEDKAGMRAWVAAFDQWMTTSVRGCEEMAAKNNHGSWYAVQEAGLYEWLGEKAAAREVYERAKVRIVKQIEPTGRQPLEIVREDGFGYSVFNASALGVLASMAERDGVDLWHFEQDGRGLQKAIDYLMPFANGSAKWKDNQLKKIDAEGLAVPVMKAARVYGDPKYAAWLEGEKERLAGSWVQLTGE